MLWIPDQSHLNLSTKDYITFDSSLIQLLWIPDLWFMHSTGERKHNVVRDNQLLKVAPDGRIFIWQGSDYFIYTYNFKYIECNIKYSLFILSILHETWYHLQYYLYYMSQESSEIHFGNGLPYGFPSFSLWLSIVSSWTRVVRSYNLRYYVQMDWRTIYSIRWLWNQATYYGRTRSFWQIYQSYMH